MGRCSFRARSGSVCAGRGKSQKGACHEAKRVPALERHRRSDGRGSPGLDLGIRAESQEPAEVHPGAAGAGADRHPGGRPRHGHFTWCRYVPDGRRGVRAVVPPRPPADSRLWGYADVTAGQAPNHRYLGGVIVAQKNRPVRLVMTNGLPSTHPLPVDTTIMGAEGAQNRDHRAPPRRPGPLDQRRRAVLLVHTRGRARRQLPEPRARSPDRPSTTTRTSRARGWCGTTTTPWARPGSTPTPGWPAPTSSATRWRTACVSSHLLPSREIPLVIQDKTFVDGSDPGYVWGRKGDLWYPYRYEPGERADGPLGLRSGGRSAGSVTGPLARSLGGARVLRRHHHRERGRLSVPARWSRATTACGS